MKYHMIALDLDGTALQEDHLTLSSRLSQALVRAHQAGVAVTPITGRPFELLPPALQQPPCWAGLVVLCNGAQVRRLAGGELLCAHTLAVSGLPALVQLARQAQLPIEVCAGGLLYLTQQDWQQERACGTLPFHLEQVLPQKGRRVKDLERFCAENALPMEKVNLPYIPAEKRPYVEQALAALPVSAVWSGPASIEITHPEATKAQGMLEVCRQLAIPAEQVLALGDSGNDVPMLQAAGLGVAMGNAPGFVQAAADAVTAPNWEDGAAQALERYLLE